MALVFQGLESAGASRSNAGKTLQPLGRREGALRRGRGERTIHFSIHQIWTFVGFFTNSAVSPSWARQEHMDFVNTFVFFNAQGCETQRGEREMGFLQLVPERRLYGGESILTSSIHSSSPSSTFWPSKPELKLLYWNIITQKPSSDWFLLTETSFRSTEGDVYINR